MKNAKGYQRKLPLPTFSKWCYNMCLYKLQTRTDCPSSDVILYSGRRKRHPYNTRLVYVSVSKKMHMEPKEAEVPARLSKKFVRGRYVVETVLRKESLVS
jgi:hypothetical protein